MPNTLRLLLIEDSEEDISTCQDTAARYSEENERPMEIVECRGLEESFSKLDNSFDAAIIDLRLGADDRGGNKIFDRLTQSLYRIPVAFFTGTPDAAPNDMRQSTFIKGENSYDQIFDHFWDTFNTGLTKILGGRGLIEQHLHEIYEKCLVPNLQGWIQYGRRNPELTERAILRHALNHMQQLLTDDTEACFPDEVYLTPPLTDQIRTGSIISDNEGNNFAVLSPACDLAIRTNGDMNTDTILIAGIESDLKLFPLNEEGMRSNSVRSRFESARRNTTNNLHYLPQTSVFQGGFLNFRHISAIPKQTFSDQFPSPPQLQISQPFIKDIMARFSSYYARQGQPEINHQACE